MKRLVYSSKVTGIGWDCTEREYFDYITEFVKVSPMQKIIDWSTYPDRDDFSATAEVQRDTFIVFSLKDGYKADFNRRVQCYDDEVCIKPMSNAWYGDYGGTRNITIPPVYREASVENALVKLYNMIEKTTDKAVKFAERDSKRQKQLEVDNNLISDQYSDFYKQVENLVYQCYENYHYDKHLTEANVRSNVVDHIRFLMEDWTDEDYIEVPKNWKNHVNALVHKYYQDYDWYE